MKVTFPDGTSRDVEPAAWQAGGLGPRSPIFEIPGYFVVGDMAGQFHAFEGGEELAFRSHPDIVDGTALGLVEMVWDSDEDR